MQMALIKRVSLLVSFWLVQCLKPVVGDVFYILFEASPVDFVKGYGDGCINEVVFDLYGSVDDSVDFVRGGGAVE
jgi:hypothetical protein